ncbi:MAG: hypothetical protein K2K67_09055, partial [Treponemataceae bacterium]|nr:hypothetical protein [Treponemataceae bacterium]
IQDAFPDLAQILQNDEQTSLHIEQTLPHIEQTSLDVEQTLLDIEQLLPDIERTLLHIVYAILAFLREKIYRAQIGKGLPTTIS